MVFFEWLGPLLEVGGYLFTTIAYYFEAIPLDTVIAFFIVVIGMGLLLSVTSLFLEEMSFHIYERPRYVLLLFMAAIQAVKFRLAVYRSNQVGDRAQRRLGQNEKGRLLGKKLTYRH